MRRLLIFLGSFFFLTVAASSTADAQIYIGGHGGANFLQDSDIDNDSGVDATASFDPGFAVGGILGYRFGVSEGISIDVEGEFSYRLNDIDEISAAGFADNAGGEAQSFAWMANAWFNWEVGDSGFAPYAGGGFGGVHIDINDAEVGSVEVERESDFVIGGQLGGGVAYHLNDHFDISLDYRFLITEKAKIQELDAEYMAHSVMLGFKYLF